MRELESSNQLAERPEALSQAEIQTWIAEAVRGNRVFQKRIYEHLAPRVYRVIRKIVGSSDADDVMQDFMIQLYSKLKQFRFESSFETWAHRMAVNQSLQFLRKSNREAERLRRLAVNAERKKSSKAPNTSDDAELVDVAMENISGEQRALLHMKEVEGMGYLDIAKVLGIPEGTVGSRLNRARTDLRASLIRLGWGT